MAKSDSTKRRKRQSKVVSSDVQEDVSSEGLVETSTEQNEKEAATTDQSTEVKQVQANEEEQDSQVDSAIEVKGRRSNVTVSWDDKKEEGEADDIEMRTSAHDQMMDIDSQNNGVAGESTLAVTVAGEKKNGESKVKGNIRGDEPLIGEETAVKGKRKADSTDSTEVSPTKKTKLVNDGFCVFVGNLNNSKTYDEVKDALASYFMTQSLLVQDIRLDRSRKHAHVDLASQMDLTKVLTLNGEEVLEKPLRIEKAKVKNEEKVKVKASAEDRKAAKNARCLFLKNVPYKATKEEIMKVFPNAINVRFPGGTQGPKSGIAFVEFKNKAFATSILQKKRAVKIRERDLIIGEAKTVKANDESKEKKAESPDTPNNMLFLSNLAFTMTGKSLKKLFPTAVNVTLPQIKGKSRGYAFIKFATVEDAEQAFQSSKNSKLGKRDVKVQFYNMQENAYKTKVLSKTLIVMGLAEQTSAETLKKAFDGARSARIIVDKQTGVSKRFGFVDFDTEENCKAGKEIMEDCEIDGSKVSVEYARFKGVKAPPGVKKSSLRPSARKAAGLKAKRGGKGGSMKGKGRRARTPRGAIKKGGGK